MAIEKVRNFEHIESVVSDDKKLMALPLVEVRRLRHSLLTESPTSKNPEFHQRFMRVNEILSGRITEIIAKESKKQWWEKPLGIVFLLVFGAVIAAGIIYFIGWS